MKKKNIKSFAAALLSAALFFQLIPIYAAADEFVDPAQAYAQYTASHTATEPDESVLEETTASQELPEETTATTAAMASNNGTAVEITLYNCKYNLTVGDSFKISYRLKPTSSKDTVKFTTTSSKVAKVASDGTVTAVGAGTAVITATAASGVKDKFTLKVSAAESEEQAESAEGDIVSEDGSIASSSETDASESAGSSKTAASSSSSATDIELKHTSVTLIEGETYQIRYSLSPAGCTDTVTFRTLSSSIAAVDSSGLVTAKGAGNTRIVCKTGSGKSIKLSVTVISFNTQDEQDQIEEASSEKEYDENGVLRASKIVLNDESLSLKIGEKAGISGKVYPSGCTFSVSYSSDDPSVARVTAGGNIVAVAEGNCIITAQTDNGKSDRIYVTVYGSVINGIDVSKWNGEINWKAVKSSSLAKFAMIRASYGSEDIDPMLEANVKGCETYNIPYGFYHYTYAQTVSEARQEARYFLDTIKKYSPTYPVVLDIEESFYKSMSKNQVTDIVVAFMEELEDAGYYAMIYSYAKFFNDCVYIDRLTDYDIWVASWGDKEKLDENYSYHYGIWQYSETGTIKGIPEDVDLNYCYKDYASVIKKYGLNNL